MATEGGEFQVIASWVALIGAAAVTVMVSVEVSNHAGNPFRETGWLKVHVFVVVVDDPMVNVMGVRTPVRFAAPLLVVALRRMGPLL